MRLPFACHHSPDMKIGFSFLIMCSRCRAVGWISMTGMLSA